MTGRCKPGAPGARHNAMTTRRRPKRLIEPGHADGTDLTAAAITGPPSVIAQASLEAQAFRIAALTPARGTYQATQAAARWKRK